MPNKGSYDPITNPAREKYSPPPKVMTEAPRIWESKPEKCKGIPGKYSYPGKQGPLGPPPPEKV